MIGFRRPVSGSAVTAPGKCEVLVADACHGQPPLIPGARVHRLKLLAHDRLQRPEPMAATISSLHIETELFRLRETDWTGAFGDCGGVRPRGSLNRC